MIKRRAKRGSYFTFKTYLVSMGGNSGLKLFGREEGEWKTENSV